MEQRDTAPGAPPPTRRHPAHPVRELALQLAVGHLLPDDTADSIVSRAEKYADFLSK